MKEPEQLDLLDWLAAQTPGRLAAEIQPEPAMGPTLIPSHAIPEPVLLTRIDPDCNMRRFYSLVLVTSLWGEPGVARQWGRIGSQGQRRTDWHGSLGAAAAELERMAKGKLRKGYR